MSDARAEALELLYPEGVLPPIEEHLDALSNPYALDGVAVGLCALRIDEAGPPIQALLERAARGETLSEGEGWLLFRGLHILGGARFTPAFPALLDFLRLADPILDTLLGDVVTESLAKIVIGMFDGRVEALLSAIDDVERDDYVRDALMGAATFLTWEGRIERSRFEAFLRDFYEASKAPDGDHVWCGWQEAVALLGLRSLRPQVEEAFASERVDPQSTDLNYFLKDLAEAERSPDDPSRFAFDNLGYIEDVLVELERWPALDEGRDLDEPIVEDWERIEPVRNLYRDVGRNDPCPCGSGKKFKKCCLGS